jgi:glycosyltransferase involved in cell wall biosynthesis
MLAEAADVWVVTRANNRAAIEAVIEDVPERDRLHFVYTDLPPWARFWKRGQRGVRLYYAVWQAAALSRSRSLMRQIDFDLVWHLTIANAWIGSLAPLIRRTFIYGPVGGGVGTPLRLLPSLGMRGAALSIFRDLSRGAGRYANPMARLAWRRASWVLVQNVETRDWLPARHRTKAEVFPNVVLDSIPAGNAFDRDGRVRTALFAGRLIEWKGAALAIRAVALTDRWRLVIYGEGPDERRLRRLVDRLDMRNRIVFGGWVSRHVLLDEMRSADAFLYPSIHDDAGWVVAEAMAAGLPVICLDRGGPPVVAGAAALVVPSSSRATVLEKRLAEALSLFEEQDGAMFASRARSAAKQLTIDMRSRRVMEIIRAHVPASAT